MATMFTGRPHPEDLPQAGSLYKAACPLVPGLAPKSLVLRAPNTTHMLSLGLSGNWSAHSPMMAAQGSLTSS